jgi:hypothetical protein
MKTAQPSLPEDNSRSKPLAPKTDGREKPLLDDTSAGTTAASSINLDAASVGEARGDWEEHAKSAHVYDIEYISQKLNVDVRNGLTKEDAAYRLERDGASTYLLPRCRVAVMWYRDLGQLRS